MRRSSVGPFRSRLDFQPEKASSRGIGTMEPLRMIQGPHRSYDERLTMEAWENLLSGKEFSPRPLRFDCPFLGSLPVL